MIVEGTVSYDTVRGTYLKRPDCKHLERRKVASGEVFVVIDFESDDEVRGTLILGPGAAIRRHEHLDDNEIYTAFVRKNGRVRRYYEKCSKGNSHELVNNSLICYLIVHFNKWK